MSVEIHESKNPALHSHRWKSAVFGMSDKCPASEGKECPAGCKMTQNICSVKSGLELNRIYCMDCLEGMRQMEDKSVDLVITDPPYGIRINHNMGRRKGDKPSDYQPAVWDIDSPPAEYFDEIFRISKNQVIFGANHFISKIPYDSPCWLMWNKGFSEDLSFAQFELAWTSFDSTCKKFECSSKQDERFHPTQKPVKLFGWIIKKYAKEGDTICDPFFGSGSCLIAAIRMGHPFIGFEKERTYFDAARLRIKKAQEQGKISEWFE